jgi:uracil-DNA glycosylase
MPKSTAFETALEEHRRALAVCRRCNVQHGVSPIVSLARRPRVMLVGQAPGKVEAGGGRAFAGRAGKTLFRWFERAGVDETTARERIYIAAMTRCYPGPSPSGRGDRVPSPAERANCAGWLDAELRLVRPRLLIPVGRLAIERFLPALPLEELIGREHQVDHVGGASIAIPLPHPSGASSWIHQGDHPELLSRALALLGTRLAELRVIDSRARSVA